MGSLMRRSGRSRLVALGVVLALASAACGGDGDSNTSPGAPGGDGQQGKRGGTLNILMAADFEHIDPQRSYVVSAMNFDSRFLTRTLVSFDSKPGAAGNKLVPDLATDLGRPSPDGKTWTFTLKDGIKFDDGAPVTCADIKYGISRTFSAQITDGPKYAAQYLAVERDAKGAPVYKGPYVGGSNGGFDKAVDCSDPKTIVFRLQKPVGDFNFTTSMPAFAPVPKSRDTGTRYDRSVVSTGPYKIQSYTPDKSLVLERNPHWDAATDPIRKAYPDRIVTTFGVNNNLIDSRLIADASADQAAVMLDSQVQAQNLARVLREPRLKSRSVNGLDGFIRYLAINTAKVKDLKVRQAIQFAINKETYRGSRGGTAAGDYATTTLVPTLTGHAKFDLYPAPPQGDPAKAKSLLEEAGVKLPYPVTLDTANTPVGVRSGAAFKEALERASFSVRLNPIDQSVYYVTVGKPAVQGDLTLAAWGPDWPSASSVLPTLYDGRQIPAEGNQNFAQLNDPQVNSMLDAAAAEVDPTKQAKLWGDIDRRALEQSAIVPLVYSKTTQLVGSKVKGAYLHAYFGLLDLATLSVA